MRERSQILTLWSEADAKKEDCVLVTVVRTMGSSYRMPGARLLVMRDGRHAGSVSGGCLEEEVVKKAWWFTASGPVIRRYSTEFEEDPATASFGLGCGGTVDLLFERIRPGELSELTLLQRAAQERIPSFVAKFISPGERLGQNFYLTPRGRRVSNFDPEALEVVEREALGETADGRARTIYLAHDGEIFFQRLLPPLRLTIVGAGDDAGPLATLGDLLGWEVCIYDGRPQYAKAARFPAAQEVNVLAPGDFPGVVDEWTAAVLMSHSYTQDLAALRHLAKSKVSYLGVLGPRKRTEQLLADASINLAATPLPLYSPMGLDVGADGPEQIAVSVAAEIQAVLAHRGGGFLRQREGSIHEASTSAAWKPSLTCV